MKNKLFIMFFVLIFCVTSIFADSVSVSPVGANVYVNSNYLVKWIAITSFSNVNIVISYSNFPFSGSPTTGVIYSNLTSTGITNQYLWDMSGLPDGYNEIQAHTFYLTNEAWDFWGPYYVIKSNTTPDTTPPSIPVLSLPMNGANTVDTTPTFAWHHSTDSSGISQYRIMIDTNSYLISVTNYTSGSALSYGLHTWKVQAQDNAGNWSSYSSNWVVTITNTNFTSTTNDITPPTAPVNLESWVAGELGIRLTWSANIEADLKLYKIYRKSGSDYVEINTTFTNVFYDRTVEWGQTYNYRITAVDTNGNESLFSDTVVVSTAPDISNNFDVVLENNVITKDADYVHFLCKMKKGKKMKMKIYNIANKLVKVLFDGVVDKDQDVYTWDLNNQNNLDVPSGVYFLVVESGNWHTIKKIFVLK